MGGWFGVLGWGGFGWCCCGVRHFDVGLVFFWLLLLLLGLWLDLGFLLCFGCSSRLFLFLFLLLLRRCSFCCRCGSLTSTGGCCCGCWRGTLRGGRCGGGWLRQCCVHSCCGGGVALGQREHRLVVVEMVGKCLLRLEDLAHVRGVLVLGYRTVNSEVPLVGVDAHAYLYLPLAEAESECLHLCGYRGRGLRDPFVSSSPRVLRDQRSSVWSVCVRRVFGWRVAVQRITQAPCPVRRPILVCFLSPCWRPR